MLFFFVPRSLVYIKRLTAARRRRISYNEVDLLLLLGPFAADATEEEEVVHMAVLSGERGAFLFVVASLNDSQSVLTRFNITNILYIL